MLPRQSRRSGIVSAAISLRSADGSGGIRRVLSNVTMVAKGEVDREKLGEGSVVVDS